MGKLKLVWRDSEHIGWIRLAQGRIHWRSFFEHGSGFYFSVKRENFSRLANYRFVKKDSGPWTAFVWPALSYGGSGKRREAHIHIVCLVTICCAETRCCYVAKLKTWREVLVSVHILA